MSFRRQANRGTVLAVTLVILALGAMLGASLLFRTRAEARASSAGRAKQQAFSAAWSGIARAITVVSARPFQPGLWQDNAELFRDQPVCQDGGVDWRFTVFAAPTDPEADEPRYGVTSENGKLNVNVAPREMLLGLAGMDEQLVDCLLDWRDGDEEPRPNGAESEYYLTLKPNPYRCRNGLLLTVGELLLVKGFGGRELYGEDANRNGCLDVSEDDGEERFPPDDGNGQLDRGLAEWITTVSYELDVDSRGRPRVNINGGAAELKKLAEVDLPEQTRAFIEMLRAEGVQFAHPAQLLGMSYVLQQDHQGYAQGAKDTLVQSGVTAENLEVVLDRLTTRAGNKGRPAMIPGALNVLTASAGVLALLPGIEDNQAERIVRARATLDPDLLRTTAWLVTEGLLDPAAFVPLAGSVTTRSGQFRVRSVGYSRPGGTFCVLEAVVDIAPGRAKLLSVREQTRLGLPVPRFNGETQETEAR